MLDLNVTIDYLQDQRPYFLEAVTLVDNLKKHKCEILFPAYGVTTLYYILAKSIGKARGLETAKWVMGNFIIVPTDLQTLQKAAHLNFKDFEDAVLAASAEEAFCAFIATWNLQDYKNSSVLALSPVDLVKRLDSM